MIRRLIHVAMSLLLVGCAGYQRGCTNKIAITFGSDWLVVQHAADGSVSNCWKLASTSIGNEEKSDGIYWQSPNGHLIHLSGWYTRVQVAKESWKDAAAELKVDLSKCH